MEHRWGERSKLNIPVQVDCGPRGVVLAVMRDASASGAFLCTAAQLPLLTSVRVEFGVAAALGQTMGVDAQVVRRASDGFGLEWSELAPKAIVDLLNSAHLMPATQPAHIDGARPMRPMSLPAPSGASRTAEETVTG